MNTPSLESSLPRPHQPARPNGAQRLALVAPLAVALGLGMQAVSLAIKLGVGAGLPGVDVLLGVLEAVTWSFFVCAGVSLAVSLAEARPALAGLAAGLLTPFAVAVAKVSRR